MRSSFVQFRFDMRSRVDIGRYGTHTRALCATEAPKCSGIYLHIYAMASPSVCSKDNAYAYSQQLPHTDSASQEAVEANAASTPRTATLTGGVSP
ncbi:uncharacterized protein LOC142557837 isoform X3 [Dermacentor variabilis]|uniref:uncharacterized protein LOC142557836 isoform X3 n=1 Tax=Dermacentor variabilis TaxID=34621 RepID=UPI003F5B14FA